MSLAISLVTLVFLVVMSAFFSSSETAFLSLSKIKMRQMLKENKKAASRRNCFLCLQRIMLWLPCLNEDNESKHLLSC